MGDAIGALAALPANALALATLAQGLCQHVLRHDLGVMLRMLHITLANTLFSGHDLLLLGSGSEALVEFAGWQP
jgi:hypothetical protein